MEQHASPVGGHLRSLEGYSRRRLEVTLGSLNNDSSDQSLVALLKSFYMLPLDTLKAEFERDGKQFVSFANYDYAGIANDLRVKKAACDAIMNVGIGAGASRLVGGQRAIHCDLERDIAGFLGVEDSIVLVSGYMTNVSLVGHILTKNDLILVDDLSHNSIIVGTDVSRARVIRFAHNNLDHLESILAKVRDEADRVLIIVEGLYSMDGDIANLPRLLEIKQRYRAWLMVDEAHSLGVLGPNGRGLAEHFNVDPKQIDIIVGTMSKTLGACGGFIAGSTNMIDWLRFTLPAFVFSVGMSPALAAAVRAAIGILKSEPWRVSRVQENSRLFLEQAKKQGLDTGPAIGTGVISVLFSHQHECMVAAQSLLDAGYFAPPIPQMAVPKDKPRIRFFLSATHTDQHIAAAVETLADAMDNMRSGKMRRRARQAANFRVDVAIEPQVAFETW